MPTIRTLSLLLAMIIGSNFPLTASGPRSAPRLLTPAQWAADLKFLAETVPAKHRHAFDHIKAEVFQRAVADLEAQIPSLSDQEIIVGMARLVAFLRDGHSRLTLPLGSGEAVMPGHMATAPAREGLYLRVLPVKMLWLSDGLFVQAAAKAHESLLGARVLRIGAMTAEAAPLARFALDLRLNGGGNNYLNRTLVLALLRSSRINRYGIFFAVIGRGTYSAAQSLVNDLDKFTNVIFVGEPTGNTPSQYGDAKRYVLPNSRLTVRLSSVYWRDATADESRPWVAPDLSAPLSSTDYLENRDPALARILAYQVPATLLEQLEEKFELAGLSAAADHYSKYRNSPETAAADTEKTLLGLADYLLGRAKGGEASQILQRAAIEYPKSFAAALSLGRLSVAQGDKAKAVDALKKALALRPADPTAAVWLAKAEALK